MICWNEISGLFVRVIILVAGCCYTAEGLRQNRYRSSCGSSLKLRCCQGYQDMPARLAATWVEAAETALGKNISTIAVLSIDEILKPDGYVANLRAKGYHVEDPLPRVKSIP
jgi:hypothetical protein